MSNYLLGADLDSAPQRVRFTPQIEGVANIREEGLTNGITIEQVTSECMIFQGSWDFARNFGGEITQLMMDEIEDYGEFEADNEDYRFIIDTRSHMLKIGMYPAIPGYHCDFWPRKPGTYGQPDLTKYDPGARFYAGFVSAAANMTSRTVFIDEEVEISVDPKRVWHSVNEEIERKHKEDRLKRRLQQDGEILMFNGMTIHSATKSLLPGWRFFFRLSIVKDKKPRNQIRKQTQVYITEGGW